LSGYDANFESVMQRIALITLFVLTATVQALPPLGLTQVATDADSTSKLEVINGVAYVSHHTGVSLVDTTGLAETIVPQSSIFQSPYQPTRAVQGEDGGVYVGMNFDAGGEFGSGGAALFLLDNPTQATASWDGLFALGFSAQLWGIGRPAGSFWSDVRLHSDGSGSVLPGISPLPGNGFHAKDVLPGGLVVGDAGIPGTIGSAGVILDQNDNLNFPIGSGSLTSARERADGNGINVGYDPGYGALILYGSRDGIFIQGHSSSLPYANVIVSGTDFSLLGDGADGYSVFFPGVNPAGDDLSVPLLDYFPELN
jgi:hypothetical protein